MTEEQYQVLLTVIADVQRGVDAIGVDVAAILEHMGIGQTTEDDDPQPPDVPGWVNNGE